MLEATRIAGVLACKGCIRLKVGKLLVKGKSSCEGTCGPRVCSVTSVDSD